MAEPRTIIERYNRAIVDKSADALAALYADEGVHELPFAHSHEATLRGREAIRASYAAAWGASPIRVRDIVNVVLHEVRDDRTVVVEEDIELTNIETGAEFVASTVLVMRIEDGRITHMRDYTDNLTIARALGRLPAVA